MRRAIGLARGRGVSGFYFAIAVLALTNSFVPQQLIGIAAWVASAEARDGGNDWQRESRNAEREMRHQQKEQEREAKRQQREVEKEAKRQQREVEQEAKRQERESEKDARVQQRQQSRDEQRDVSRHERRQDDAGSRPAAIKQDVAASPVTTNKVDDPPRRHDVGRDEGKDSPDRGKNKSATKSDEKSGQEAKSPELDKPEKIDIDQPLPAPRTVLEMLERAATPAKPKPQPVAEPAKPAKNNVSTLAAPSIPAKATKPAVNGQPRTTFKRGGPDFELLQQDMFRPHEIIASNLTPADRQHVMASGFKTASTVAAPGGSGTVSNLMIPPGMTETAALLFLERAAPSALFGPNHVYRIEPAADNAVPATARDRPATNEVAAKMVEGSAAGGGANCTAGECFARELLAWKPETKLCARRVRVGLIDTSFDVAHPAFLGRKFRLEHFSGSQTLARGDWHGTAVLSVLAGNASSSTPGLIPDADFYLASTFKADAQGNAAADTMSVLKALAWLDKSNVHIINMSFSGPRNDQIELAIAVMAAKGVVFVAAAGNKGPSAPPSYPAAYPQVVAVTAISNKLNSYLYANRGDYVDVAAPGVQVLTALPEGRQGFRTGTSFAAPFITGLLAAMPAVRKGAVDKEEMLSRISFQDLGDPGRDKIYGEGLPKAPERCNDIGGLASLPWIKAAKRMSVGAPTAAESALAHPASQ